MRMGITKYSKTEALFAVLGFIGLSIQQAKGWENNRLIGNVAGLCLVAALIVAVVGSIAERKEAEKRIEPEHTSAGNVASHAAPEK